MLTTKVAFFSPNRQYSRLATVVKANLATQRFLKHFRERLRCSVPLCTLLGPHFWARYFTLATLFRDLLEAIERAGRDRKRAIHFFDWTWDAL